MATIDYPKEILPKCTLANNSHQERQRIIRTSMDSGYIVARKRFTTVPVDFTFNLVLDQQSLNYFQAWFADTLDHGLNWFNMDLAVGVDANSTHECRFIDDPKYSMTGNLYNVSANIEAVSLNLGINFDEPMQGLIASIGGVRGFEKTEEYLEKFDKIINEDYPSSGYGPTA